MLRISLTTFLAIVLLLAFGCAAIVQANVLWHKIVATVTIAILTGSVLLAVAMQTTGRWFWLGMAFTGWLYLGLIFYGGDPVQRVLLTETVLDIVHEHLEVGKRLATPDGRRVEVDEVRGLVYVGPENYETLTLEEAEARDLLQYTFDHTTSPDPYRYYKIGHFLWALLLGSIAGGFTYCVRIRTSPA